MIKLPPRYSKVLHTFSDGGMADTLLCEDDNLKRKVVVKSLKPGIEPHRLLDELAALSAIRSQYVVQVLDVIVDGGNPVGFVEEYLEGESLKPFVSGAHTCSDALKVLYPIAAGINDIHDHERVHRDLKPENMKYDAEHYLKIFDFGLAKLNNSAGTKVLYFSDGYTAPECFRKNPDGLHTYDYPVDVFAFGCVAIWLLNSGVLPPELKGYTPLLPAGFDFLNLAVPVDALTAALLVRCLSSEPSLRPSIRECKEHIGAELLRDQHKMVLTSSTRQYVLDVNRKSATISGTGSSAGSSISVRYDGLFFTVGAVNGFVAINNAPAYATQRLSGSTVIVLGSDGQKRISIACDVSHPEVML